MDLFIFLSYPIDIFLNSHETVCMVSNNESIYTLFVVYHLVTGKSISFNWLSVVHG
jgi:hypothetical protein